MELHPMRENYPALSRELTETLKRMEETIRLKNKLVEQTIKGTIHAGGKLLRPVYQLLFSQFRSEQDRGKTITLVASIEMLHMAILIHNDTVDEVGLRHSQSNIRSQFGNVVSVYTGDYLFVCYFKLLSDYSTSLKSLQLSSHSMEKILNGELGQMDDRYDYELSVREYLENTSGETAELSQLSCSVGAFESGTSGHLARKAGDTGLSIGMTFQVIDDILDYTKKSQEIGKPVLGDVRQGVYSLPLVCFLQKDKQSLLPYLEKETEMTEEDIKAVHKTVERTGGVGEARELAATYTEKALEEIRKLPDTSLRTRENLFSLTQLILDRKD